MAENIDIDNLRNALDEFVRRLEESSSAISDEERERRKSEKALDEAKKSIEDYQKKQSERIQKVTKELETLGRGLTNSGGSFKVLEQGIDLSVKALGGLATKIPFVGAVVGGALKALGESAGEVAKLMVDQFQQAWNAYKDLQDTGVVTSFENLRDVSRDTGLLYQDVNKALSKHTVSIASFGGSMIVGMKAFGEVSRELTDVRRQFGAMGISSAEFTEFQAKYMAQEQSYGRIRGRDAASLAKGTQDYIENLDALSKLTGASRRDLESQRQAARSETRFRAVLEGLGPDTQKAFENVNSYLQTKVGPNIAQGFRDATSGAETTDAAKALIQSTGGASREIIAQLRKGLITEGQAVQRLAEASKAYSKQARETAQYTGDANLYTKNYVESLNLVRAGTEDYEKEQAKIREAAEKNRTGQNKQTAALSNTEKQLESASRNLQDFATSSELLPKVMDAFSSGLDGLTEQLAKISGKSIPDDVKARQDERKAIEATAKAQREYNQILDESTSKIDEQVANIDKQIQSAGTGRMAEQQIANLEARKQRLLAKRATITEARQKPGDAAAVSGAAASGITGVSSAAQRLQQAEQAQSQATQRRQEVSPTTSGAGKPLIPVTGGESTPATGTSAGPTSDASAAGGMPDKNAAIAAILESGPNRIKVRTADGKIVIREGTVAWRMNNPGNIRYNDWVKSSLGAIGWGNAGTSGDFAVFPTLDAGKKAREKLLFARDSMYINKSISQAMSAYAPAADGNNPRGYASEIASSIGVNVGTLLRDLNDQQRNGMMDYISKKEGFKEGKVLPARTGGIFRGPSTGYNVELHGEEVVIPKDTAVTKDPLNSSVLGGGGGEKFDQMLSLFETLINKQDVVIDLLDNNNAQNRRMVQAMV